MRRRKSLTARPPRVRAPHVSLPAGHLLCLLALLLTGASIDAPLFAVSTVSAYLAGLLAARTQRYPLQRVPEWIPANALLVLTLGILLAQGLHPALSIQYWLGGVLVLRVLRTQTVRDWGFTLFVVAALILSASRVYDEPSFLLFLTAEILLAPFALYACQIAALEQRAGTRSGPPSSWRPPSTGGVTLAPTHGRLTLDAPDIPRDRTHRTHLPWGAGLMTALGTVIVATGLFVVVPRRTASRAVTDVLGIDSSRLQGISETVAPGAVDRVRESRGLVMTVETVRPMLWRGEALDVYEEGQWRSMQIGWWDPITVRPPPWNPEYVRCRFRIRNLQRVHGMLLSAGAIRNARFGETRWAAGLRVNTLTQTLDFWPDWHDEGPADYELLVEPGTYLPPARLDQPGWRIEGIAEQDVDVEAIYRQIPDNLSPKIRDLAQQLTRSAEGPEAKAEAVQRYLQEHCTYALSGLANGNTESLEYFLFHSRKGHCQYFATALAVLLRCADVSTRVVRGFMPGTFRDGVCVVRLSDAHLWTEVHVPGKGWRSYDPTPPDTRWLQTRLTPLIEKIELWWYTDVTSFDTRSQRDLRARAAGSLRALRARLAETALRLHRSVGGYLTLAGLVGSVLLLGVLRWRRAFPPQRNGRPRPSHALSRELTRYLRFLRRRGYAVMPGTTLQELLARLAHDGADIHAQASELTCIAHETQYGGIALTDARRNAVHDAIRAIQQWSRQRTAR